MSLQNGGTSLTMALALSGMDTGPFWLRYIGLGGSRAPHELFSYLEGLVAWPTDEHNAAARALNEYCTQAGLGSPASYAEDL